MVNSRSETFSRKTPLRISRGMLLTVLSAIENNRSRVVSCLLTRSRLTGLDFACLSCCRKPTPQNRRPQLAHAHAPNYSGSRRSNVRLDQTGSLALRYFGMTRVSLYFSVLEMCLRHKNGRDVVPRSETFSRKTPLQISGGM